MNKPLFEVKIRDRSKKPISEDEGVSMTIQDFNLLFRDGALDKLESIGELEENKIIKYKSSGSWSTHELLAYLIAKTGPADVYISTWTMGEDPARSIFQLKEKGLIKQLHCLFDYRIDTRAGEAFQFMKSIATTVRLDKCHAKVFVLKNERWGVTVVGSSNFSKNRRIEAGTIFINQEAADFDAHWITNIINKPCN